MATVEGAVVVRRPGIAETSDRIQPAHTLDFVTTLQSYFEVFRSSLLPRYGLETGSETLQPSAVTEPWIETWSYVQDVFACSGAPPPPNGSSTHC